MTFKLGDKVSDPVFGDGSIVKIYTHKDKEYFYPLKVKFDKGDLTQFYTLDGRWLCSGNISLTRIGELQ